MRSEASNGSEFFGGDEINMIDLVYEWIAVRMKVVEDVMDMEIMEDLEFHRLQAWMENFKVITVIRDHTPDHHQMFLHLRRCRQQQLLQSPLNKEMLQIVEEKGVNE